MADASVRFVSEDISYSTGGAGTYDPTRGDYYNTGSLGLYQRLSIRDDGMPVESLGE